LKNNRGESNTRIREERNRLKMIIDTVEFNSVNDQLQNNTFKISAAGAKVYEK